MIFSILCPCCFFFSLSQDFYLDFYWIFCFYSSRSYCCHGFLNASFSQYLPFCENFCTLDPDVCLYFDFLPSQSYGIPSAFYGLSLWTSLVCLFSLYSLIFLFFSLLYLCVWNNLYFCCGLVLYFWTWLVCLCPHFWFSLWPYYWNYVCF